MLTPDQLQAIDQHLRKENWLLNEDMITELTDHYINGISERTAHGMAFDVALREIHRDFGSRKGLLAMEETYQTQKARQISLDEWREVQTFFTGKRVTITLCVFITLYYLNTVTNQQETINSFFYFSQGIVIAASSGAWLLSMIQGLKAYKHDRSANVGTFFSRTSMSFILLYALCYIFLLSSKFLAPYVNAQLSASLQPWIATLIQTMVAAYFMGSVLALRKVFSKTPKLA